MRVSKKLAALVAASSLAGGALALTAPMAADAAVPATADVYGAVTVNGAPASNAFVELIGVNADGSNTNLGYGYTDAAGQYYFDFGAANDDAGASDGTATASGPRTGYLDNLAPTQTSFKLYFGDGRDDVRGQLAWNGEYTGDQPTLKRATPVARNLAGQTVVPTADLAVDSGAQGTVNVPAPAGYYVDGEVDAYDVDGNFVGAGDFNTDPTDDANDPTTSYDESVLPTWEINYLYPGGDYTFQFTARAVPITPSPTVQTIYYIGSFYGNSTLMADAKVVKTTAGAYSAGIDGTLTNVLQADVKPSIKGQVAPGKKLKADPGTWNLNAEARFSYQWTLNGKLVSTDAKYKLPKKAKKSLGKKLRLSVTNQVGDFAGTVALKPVKVKFGAALKGKPKATYVGGKRVVKVAGTIKLRGVKKKARGKALKSIKVTVFEIDKKDDSVMVKKGRAKVKNGNVSVLVKGLISGKHTLEVVVTGKKIANIVRTFKVKV